MTNVNTNANGPRPSLERLFLVAAGVEAWTDVERTWIGRHPQFSKLETQFREWAERLGMRETLTPEQLVNAAQKVLGPYQDRLEEFLAEEDAPDDHDFSAQFLIQLLKQGPPSPAPKRR